MTVTVIGMTVTVNQSVHISSTLGLQSAASVATGTVVVVSDIPCPADGNVRTADPAASVASGTVIVDAEIQDTLNPESIETEQQVEAGKTDLSQDTLDHHLGDDINTQYSITNGCTTDTD